MATIERKNIDAPDEARTFDKGRVAVVSIGEVTLGRAVFEPGWRWSECVKPLVKTDSCQVNHRTFIVSGRLNIRANDGTEVESGPGDLLLIAPGHDAWVVGDEACVAIDFDESSKDYARPV